MNCGDFCHFLFRYGVGRILFTNLENVLKCSAVLGRASVSKSSTDIADGVRMSKERRKRDREPATQKIIESAERKPVQCWNQEMLDPDPEKVPIGDPSVLTRTNGR
jgi:hypothetical protein